MNTIIVTMITIMVSFLNYRFILYVYTLYTDTAHKDKYYNVDDIGFTSEISKSIHFQNLLRNGKL